jgi:hypothetical protein
MPNGIRLTQATFVKAAREIHGKKYSYSRTVFTRCSEKVNIVCRKHGDFEQRAGAHLMGQGCRACAEDEKFAQKSLPKITFESFLQKALSAHGDYYDYSQVVLNGFRQKIKIVCPEHGVFEQGPTSHCKGRGCARCGNLEKDYKTRPTIKDVGPMLKKLHPTLKFSNLHNVLGDKINCKCRKHGEFKRGLRSLLDGKGCSKCRMEEFNLDRTYTTEVFIEKAKEKYGDYYDYSKTEYINCSTPITIGCPVHGEFIMSGKLHLSNPGGRCCPGFKKDSRVVFDDYTFTVLSATEARALKYIFETTRIKPAQLKDRSAGNLPIIHGKFGNHKRYLPDFYVEKKNLLIEVKAPGSFGIARGGFMGQPREHLVKMMQQKAIATEAAGYNFEVYVMDKVGRVELPKDWMYYPPKKLIALFD